MGPERIVRQFLSECSGALHYKIILYGSLAATGRGHGTDTVIRRNMPEGTEILFDTVTATPVHPNTMDLVAEYRDHVECRRAYSLGGGAIAFEGQAQEEEPNVYPLSTFHEIASECTRRGMRLWQYAAECEIDDIFAYLTDVWTQMKESIRAGLEAEGVLPGGLNIQRKAHYLMSLKRAEEAPETARDRTVCAYAYAVAEQNAAGEVIVTAPTCGSCGVMPAVLKYMQDKHGFTDEEVVRALASGGIVGNLIKTNASISGAECGCQAEIGSACSMTAAALTELFHRPIPELEYAAELSMEHHLGLTCDPVKGLVQIPCIEPLCAPSMRSLCPAS